MITLYFWFVLKHFIVDFPLQVPFMYKNKGIYGHIGGLVHAQFHGMATYIILLCITHNWWTAFDLSALDFIIHYHVDWAKMNLNKFEFTMSYVTKDTTKLIVDKREWKPDTSEYFWWLLGLDQFLHYMTYMLIIYLAVNWH